MKAEIISVGTELLMGDITDTNSSKIARELLSIGIGTYHMQTVGDNPARIKEALVHAAKRSDLIILTGGLGPTQDDITKQVAADFLGEELVEDKAQIDKIINEYKKRGKVPTEMVHREALTFKRGETLFNDVGLACGCAAELKNAGKMTRHLILLPGVPYEMAYMLENEVKPYLRRHAEKETVIESLFMNFNDIGEPQVAEALDEQIQSQANPTIAIYAKPRHITVRISAKAADSKTASRMNQQAADRILEKLSEQFIGYGEEQTIETHVVELMKREKVTLSVAEEFTAGDIMSTLTKVAGVSSVFTGGLVTLTDQTTESQFGLTNIESRSKEETAGLLAEKCAEKFQTTIGLSALADLSLNPANQLLSGTGYVAVTRKGEAVRVKKMSLPEKPEPVLREIIKNEALALLKMVME